MLPKDSSGSVVWCQEMASARALAQGLIDRGDWMAAKVIFKDGYARIVEEVRAAGVAPVWTLLQGVDDDSLERALLTGIAHGRVTSGFALAIRPSLGMKSLPIYPMVMGAMLMATTEEEED